MGLIYTRRYSAILSMLLLAWIGLFLPALALPACAPASKCCGAMERTENCCGACCRQKGPTQNVKEQDAAAQRGGTQIFFGSRAKVETPLPGAVDAAPRMVVSNAPLAPQPTKPTRLYIINRTLLI